MNYEDMVGHYVVGEAVYRIIEWDSSHGFYLEAVSSDCERVWKDISERAIDRTFYGDWHSNFWDWKVSSRWLRDNPEIRAEIEQRERLTA